MTLLTIESWAIAMDVLGLICCLMTLCYVLGQRWNKRRSTDKRITPKHMKVYTRSLIMESRQQFKKIFDNLRKQEGSLPETINPNKPETSVSGRAEKDSRNGERILGDECPAGGGIQRPFS